jgi:menaquinone-dependent protoporphyrinogen oxidase
MNVLVCFASRHGSTEQLARVLGDDIARAAAASAMTCSVDVRPVDQVSDVTPYAAVVIGSAIYMGDWLAPAKAFVSAHGGQLASTAVWLFSSGPLAGQPRVAMTPAKVATLMHRCGARDHKLFGGRVDHTTLSFGEKAIVRMVGAPEGDFRDWQDVAQWASVIVATLVSREEASSV